MSRFWMILAVLIMAASVGFAQVPGSVVITEVMYDDAGSPEIDWVELHNTTGAAIDLSDWVLYDDDTYPAFSGEGGIQIPTGTTIGADAYLVISRDVTGIPGVVQCTAIAGGSFILGNSGDNLALYSAPTDGILIDGSTSVFFPDEGVNGTSVEKCDPNAAWTGDAAAWHPSETFYSAGDRYRFCSPGEANSPCEDLTPPALASCVALSPTEVDVLFTESVEQLSAEDVNNYVIMPGGIVPNTATRDATNFALVHLTVDPLSSNTYTVIANDIQDLFGNFAADATCEFTINLSISPCDVVITEIMYDDTTGPDAEWVEIYNRTANEIDISGWVLVDDNVYPGDGGEGMMEVPSGTLLPAGGYAILCKADLPGITGETICTPLTGSVALSNTGDNLALYTAAVGGQLVDGTLTENYPDLAGSNVGNSIEKCDYNSCWTNDPAAWTECKVSFATVGQYRHCTPFGQGFCCPDPVAGTISVSTFGPPWWEYTLTHVSGCLDRVVFTNFCTGTVGSVTNEATTFWSVLPGGDGNDGDSIIFVAVQPLTSGSVTGFVLQHPSCADFVNWNAGDNSGVVDGPLPVELNGFAAVAGNGEVTVQWSTASESELEKFEIRRDGQLVAQRAASNSASGSSYSYTDGGLTNDVSYSYELAVISLNGEREVLATQSATPSATTMIVSEFALHQNYPNPFNPTTSIRFDLAEAADVTLKVFNVAGQEVASLVSGNLVAGAHTVNFDGANLTSGVYLYRLTTGEFTQTQKMMLLK
ncbi:MAG: lamin tail domain-containing protein [Calditrichaeota bacterium]|nr:lamin tail domain-containing protein [Calditrichota bacterium]